MSSDQTISKYNRQVNSNRPTPLKIISQLFDYYKGREYALVNLLRSKGATGVEIAAALEIDPALISRNYPIGGKK